jgi:hypothetical protein
MEVAHVPSGGPEDRELDAVVRALREPVERVFAELAPIGDALAVVVAEVRASGRRPRVADLLMVRPEAERTITGDTLLVGAGVVIAPGVLEDADRHLEWRQHGSDGRPVALLLDVDPASDDPYDYPEMEWFRIPRDEGRRMVGGPYFDYRGAERYALTVAVPVVVDGEFVGVAGADVPLAHLESELLPVLRRLPLRSALVNHEQRVVTANTPHFVTGARVRVDPESGARRVPVVADLPWDLVLVPED